ncbi:MAG: hypothetical protein HF975_03550 [ANME-2 cluster archaeon]|nr:hypothetical protein [ANME-2 cluster archaeon]
MMNITQDMIKDSFSERTFYRGLDYYENGYVIGPVILDNTLYARVIGTMETPYEVKAFINNHKIDTKCTCPVGYKCKHAVALLLNWVHEPSSFIDSNKFITSLNSMSKHEIINIVKKIINHNPAIVCEYSINADERPQINIDAISNKIDWIVCEDLDYYHIWDAVRKLEEIQDIADGLMDKELYKNAAEIYLELIKGCITAFDQGADDSGGSMGEFAIQCVSDFNQCMKQINDPAYKDMLLETILDIANNEDYGLDTWDMLFGIINKDNISHVEEYLLEKLNAEKKYASESHYQYKKNNIIHVLMDLYAHIGMPQEKLRLAQFELITRDDHIRLANVLIGEKRYEDAFDIIKKGMALSEGSFNDLQKLYFSIASILIDQKPDLVDFSTSIDFAFDLMSRYFYKDDYEKIKKVFSGIGKLEEFKATMLTNMPNRNAVVSALLHDGDLQAAIDVILTEPKISSNIIIDVSKTAVDKGMEVESSRLTKIAIERGWMNAGPPMDTLLKVMTGVLDMHTLENMCNSIIKKGSYGNALMLIPYLLDRYPELSAALVMNFITHMPVEVVGQVACAVAKKSPKQGASLCRIRINEDILRSHIHYDKVVFLFKIMRGICSSIGKESDWVRCIRSFAAENKGKKKLIDMMRKEFEMSI